jgi:hypothetical protein
VCRGVSGVRDGAVTWAGLVSLLLSILPRPPERRDRERRVWVLGLVTLGGRVAQLKWRVPGAGWGLSERGWCV